VVLVFRDFNLNLAEKAIECLITQSLKNLSLHLMDYHDMPL
jgi:hypothetical protein